MDRTWVEKLLYPYGKIFPDRRVVLYHPELVDPKTGELGALHMKKQGNLWYVSHVTYPRGIVEEGIKALSSRNLMLRDHKDYEPVIVRKGGTVDERDED